MNDDRAVGHAGHAAAIGCTNLSAGVPTDADESPRHLGAKPVGRVTGHLDAAILHIRAQMHASIASDGNPAAGHRAANPLDLPRVTADLQLVAAFAFHREEVINTALPFSEKNRQTTD